MPTEISSDPRHQPAGFVQERLDAMLRMTSDPSFDITGMPPNMGNFPLKHVDTFSGRASNFALAYLPSDEAIQHSWQNAKAMRNDVGIAECIEARQRCTALLDWHLEPESDSSHEQKELCAELTKIIERIPRFVEYRNNLMHAIWYGKYAVQNRYRWVSIEGRDRVMPARVRDSAGWLPINGDKLVFRFDDGDPLKADQLGIRVGAGYGIGGDFNGYKVERAEPTGQGLAYFLPDWQRDALCVHKHMIEDADWEDPRNAGTIHGVGIRSRIYWEWFQKQNALAFLMEYLERSAGGMEVWTYPAGDPTALANAKAAARERMGNGRNIIFFPKPLGEAGDMYDVRIIEAGMAGIESLKDILITYFGHRIKRYILGQTLSTEAEATGLGSGVADLHLDSLLQIVKYDATNLEETLTYDLVRNLKNWNFPWAKGIHVRFVIDTESPDVDKKLEAWRKAWEMGAKLRESDVMDMIGAAMPGPEDRVLVQQQQQEQPPAGGGAFSGVDLNALAAKAKQQMAAGAGAEARPEAEKYSATFKESDHPREADGKFGTKGGAAGGDTPEKPATESKASPAVQAWAAKRFDNPEHAAAFVKWFGDSKVVDDKGEPLVVYHGTNAEFEEFDRDRGGLITDGLGSWFAADSNLSNVRSGQQVNRDAVLGNETGARSMPVYLGIARPLHVQNRQQIEGEVSMRMTLSEGTLKQLQQIHGGMSARADEAFPKYYTDASARKRINDIALRGSKIPGTVEAAREALKDFDGIVVKNDQGHGTAYVAFSPNQIKSATGNQGTFDPDDNRITYAADSSTKDSGWRTIGGSPVHIGANGTIDAGCPGLKGEDVEDLIDEEPESRKKREVRQTHAEARGLTGHDVSASQAKKLHNQGLEKQYEAAATAAKKFGVATADVVRALPDAHQMLLEQWSVEEQARKRARQMTGLNAGVLAKIENSYRDYSSVPGFDDAAASMAEEFPHLGFGRSGDVAAEVWEFMRHGSDKQPQLHDEATAELAAEIIAKPKKQQADESDVWTDSGFEDGELVTAGVDDSFDPEKFARRSKPLAGQKSLSWDESDHPRGDDGKFIASGRIESARTDPNLAEQLRSEVTDPEQRKNLDAMLGGGASADEESASISPEEDYKTNGVRSKRFKAWFGDWENDPANASKVVNPETGEPQETAPISGEGSKVMKDGRPVTVYHGTSRGGFESFDKGFLGNATSGGSAEQLLYGPGFYFTEDRSIADEYSSNGKAEMSVVPVEESQEVREKLIEAIETATAKMEKTRREIFGHLSPEDFAPFREDTDEMRKVVEDLKRGRSIERSVRFVAKGDAMNLSALEKMGVKTNGLLKVKSSREVKEVFLSIKKPFDIDGGRFDLADLPRDVLQQYRQKQKDNAATARKNQIRYGEMADEQRKKNAVSWASLKSSGIPVDILKDPDTYRIGVAREQSEVRNAWDGLSEDQQDAWTDYVGKVNQEKYFQNMSNHHREMFEEATSKDTGVTYGTLEGILRTKTAVNQALQSAGYDGLTHIGGSIMGSVPHKVWIAFEPNQIKATDNQGTFDPSDDRMRYAKKPKAQEGQKSLDWDEDQHPRDNSGQFASSDESKSSKPEPEGVPGQQMGLFNAEEFKTGQMQLFNVVRPSGKKTETTGKGLSELEKIEDELKSDSEKSKSLPGQGTLEESSGKSLVKEHRDKQMSASHNPSQLRAKAGGEYGPNGEWYDGGAWIATTDMPKKVKQKIANAATGKVVVEPGKYEVPPAGKISILDAIGGTYFNHRDGELNHAFMDYQKLGEEERQQVKDAADAYKNGERFVDASKFWGIAKFNDIARMMEAEMPLPGRLAEAAKRAFGASFEKYKPNKSSYSRPATHHKTTVLANLLHAFKSQG